MYLKDTDTITGWSSVDYCVKKVNLQYRVFFKCILHCIMPPNTKRGDEAPQLIYLVGSGIGNVDDPGS